MILIGYKHKTRIWESPTLEIDLEATLSSRLGRVEISNGGRESPSKEGFRKNQPLKEGEARSKQRKK